MNIPQGLDIDRNNVIRLMKAIPGLKQSGRAWHKDLRKTLISLGWSPLVTEPCIYQRGDHLLLVYTDDFLAATGNKAEYDAIVKEVRGHYGLVDNGELSQFLGMRFKRYGDRYEIDQAAFAHDLLQKFKMHESNPVGTPACADINKPPENPETLDLAKASLYRSAVGGLLYLNLMTRAELGYAIGRLTRKMAVPTDHDWASLKRVLRFIAGSIDTKLILRAPAPDAKLTVYSDSDYGGYKPLARSTSGFACFLDNNLICSKSRMQKLVATSTCEAELLAATLAIKEAIYLRNLMSEMKLLDKPPPTEVRIDNSPAIDLAKNPMHHARTKHFSIRSHWVREQVDAKLVSLSKVPTNDNVADIFTKPLARPKFKEFTKVLLNH